MDGGSFWSDLGFEYSLEDDEVCIRLVGIIDWIFFGLSFRVGLRRNRRIFKYGIDLGR